MSQVIDGNHINSNRILGERLLARIADLGITQTEAGRLAGLQSSWLNAVLRSKRGVQTVNLLKLAEALDTTASYLLGETISPTREQPSGVAAHEHPVSDQFFNDLPGIMTARIDDVDRSHFRRPPILGRDRPFLTPEAVAAWQATFPAGESLGLPLFHHPADEFLASVDYIDRPLPTPRAPTTFLDSGAYAVTVSDRTMEPAIPVLWLAYAQPGYISYGSNVIIRRLVQPDHVILSVRRLLSSSRDANIKLDTISGGVEEVIPDSEILSLHPIVATSRDLRELHYDPDTDDPYNTLGSGVTTATS